MASKKLVQKMRSLTHGRAPMREVVDAYAEGILDGIEAERRRQRDYFRPLDRGSSLHRQVTDNGKTFESLLEAPPK